MLEIIKVVQTVHSDRYFEALSFKTFFMDANYGILVKAEDDATYDDDDDDCANDCMYIGLIPEVEYCDEACNTYFQISFINQN